MQIIVVATVQQWIPEYIQRRCKPRCRIGTTGDKQEKNKWRCDRVFADHWVLYRRSKVRCKELICVNLFGDEEFKGVKGDGFCPFFIIKWLMHNIIEQGFFFFWSSPRSPNLLLFGATIIQPFTFKFLYRKPQQCGFRDTRFLTVIDSMRERHNWML